MYSPLSRELILFLHRVYLSCIMINIITTATLTELMEIPKATLSDDTGFHGPQPLEDRAAQDRFLQSVSPNHAQGGFVFDDWLQLARDTASAASSSRRCHSAGLQRLQTVFVSSQDECPSPITHAPDAWESRKHELRRLYLYENKTLPEIREIMKRRGLEARYGLSGGPPRLIYHIDACI
jgi:hypothetical protein